jgi:hypothetical protein
VGQYERRKLGFSPIIDEFIVAHQFETSLAKANKQI